MKAWYMPAPRDMIFTDIDMPSSPSGDEILVKVISVCLCNGSDPGIFNGNAGYSFPMVFGHEAYGIIEQKGKSVKDFEVGDRVSWWCTIGVFTEYVKVNTLGTAVFKLPDNITDTEAPVVELIIASSRTLMPFMDAETGMLAEKYKGGTLTVAGLGPSGLNAVQLAQNLGFSKVCGWDLHEMRRNIAENLGAFFTANPSDSEFARIISSSPESDIGIDMMDDDILPEKNTFDTLVSKMKYSGTIVTYGHPEHGRTFRPDHFQGKNLTMIPPENDLNLIRKKGKYVMDMLSQGKIQISPMITGVHEFSEVKNVFYSTIEQPQKHIKEIFIL